jgi:hypothetical protein
MTDDDNFFSRWSRRKAQVRTGQPLPAEPSVPVPPVVPVSVARAGAPLTSAAPPATQPPANATLAQPAPEKPPALTLDDVAQLTREADFSPFVGREVPAQVRNAAMKKLFTDPHYNVMDGLDIYIDDYSKPSPLSAAMMAKMVGAQFLKLVDDTNEVKPAAAPTAGATEATDAPQTDLTAVAPPAHAEAAADTAPDPTTGPASAPAQPKAQDDHADLQLQPDHAPEPQSPGRGAG